MENMNIDLLKSLKIEGKVTDDEYRSRVLDFAEDFLIKDSKFDILGIVKRGSFGGVFAAREPGSWEKMAIKIVMKENCSRREIEDWPNLKHPSILSLLSKQYIPRIDAYIFITELCTYTLEIYLAEKWFLRHKNAPLAVKRFLREILQGLDYLHQRNCGRVNLTANNIWISNDFRAVITNLGNFESSVAASKNFGRDEILLQFGPPETCKYMDEDSSSSKRREFYDVWNYGILVLNIFTKNYVQEKIPDHITNWCDHVYTTVFKVLQREKFKKYCKKVFPACKIRKKYRNTVINFITTSLRILPEERPSADKLLLHRYFKIDGFLSVEEKAWDNKVKTTTPWKFISRPSMKQIIHIKKQSLEKIIESMSKRDGCKCKTESRNRDMKEKIRDSEDENGKRALEDNFKDRIDTDVRSQSIVDVSGLNACKTDKNVQHPTTSEFQNTADTTEEKKEKKSISNMCVETYSEELKLESDNFTEFSAKAIVSWLKPVLFKISTESSCNSEKLSKWISYESINLDKPSSLLDETATKREMKLSPLSELDTSRDSLEKEVLVATNVKTRYFSESDVGIFSRSNTKTSFHGLNKTPLSPHSYPTRSIHENNFFEENKRELEYLPNSALYSAVECPHSKSLKNSVVETNNCGLEHQGELDFQEEDLTKCFETNLRNESFPCLIGSVTEQSLQRMKTMPASDLELQRMFATDKTDEMRRSMKFQIDDVKVVKKEDNQNLKIFPSLTDITKEMSRGLNERYFVPFSEDYKLEKLFKDTGDEI